MKWFYSGWAVVVTICLLTTVKILDPTPIQSLRLQTFDALQTLDEPKNSDEVVIINIGEKSLQQWGQWPWPRQNFAQLIHDIRQKNGGMIGLTVMFPEADRFGGDEVLASWIKGNGVILSQTPSTRGVRSSGPHIGTGTIGPLPAQDFLLSWPNLVTNIPTLEQHAEGIGVLASAPQPDLVTRTYPLAIGVEGKIYPSLAIELLRTYTQKPSYMLKTSELGIQEFAVPPFEPIVTQTDGTAFIRFNNTFEEVEYVDINSLPDLKGKFVIVGVSAEGIQNPVPTPRGNMYPQQIQGHMLQNFVDGSNITRNELLPFIELLVAFMGMVLIGFAVYKLPIWAGLVTTLTILGGIVYYSVHSYTANLVLFDATFPVISGFLVFTHSAFNNFYKQYRLRQQIKGQFSKYISPDYVDMLVKDPSLMKLGGERREMSFLFADIVGFTPISEKYMKQDDPEGLVDLINNFLDRMTKIILANGGTIDKYMGDCIMAFWNAPIPCDNHADMALKSAIEIELLGDELEKEMEKLGLPRVKFGTGINTGTCIVGNMGSESRLDYSVIGDAVNLGARLEAETRKQDTPILFSEFTLNSFKEPSGIVYEKLGSVNVKGKEEPVKIYAPLINGESAKRLLYK